MTNTGSLNEGCLLLITEDLLTTLSSCDTVLLCLSELAGSELLLALSGINLVAHRVEHVLLLSLSLIDSCTGTLTFNPVVAGSLKTTFTHSPDFRANGLGEVARVGDDEDTSTEVLEGGNEGSKRLAIEVIGRLI